MKRIMVLLACALFLAVAATAGFAQEKATPKEVVQKVNEAVNLIKEKGDAALDTLRDKKGPFVWKDAYLFVINFDGIMLMHPMNQKLEGRNQLPVKDSNGKLFNAEILAVAKSPAGEGWVDYAWIKPGEKTASPKVSFVKAVPGKNMLVGGGLYDITKEAAEKESK